MVKELNSMRPLFSRKDKYYYVALFAMMIVGAFLDVIGVGAIPVFVATLAVPERILEHPVAAGPLAALGIENGTDLAIWGCVGLLIVFVIKNAFLSFLHYAQIRITEVHRVRLSDRLFRAYMHAPLEFHLSRNSAELLRNVQAETRELIVGLLNPVLNASMGTLMTLGIIVLLALVMPPIVLGAAAGVGIASWIFIRIFRMRLKRYGEEAKFERKESIRAVNQGLGGLVDAIVLRRVDHFTTEFHRSMRKFATVDRLRQFIAKSAPMVLETVAAVGLLLIVLTLMLGGTDAAVLVPTLAGFGAAIVRLKASISLIVAGISQMNYSMAAIPIVVGDLQLLEKGGGMVQKQTKRPKPIEFRREIVLDGVTYAYPNTDSPAVADISLSIPRGTSVAFVGSTGSGKSTLINVILGLLNPSKGAITVDGIDIHANLAAWHANLGYVPQTIFLLDDTIRGNIAFGVPDAELDEDKLWTAIRAAQLEEFILTLPAGLETVVGERGVRLSGGQRQRVGLARALYHNPEILIMDEATSSLDNQTESLVMRALEDLKEGRTFIMIAHRLSTVRNCDQLYFIRDGRIEASGTYDELSVMHGDFRRMADVA